MTYRPQSPDLSSYAPQSPDISSYRPQSPDLSGIASGVSPKFPPGNFNPLQTQQRQQHHRFANSNGFGGYGPVTSNPQFAPQFYPNQLPPQQQFQAPLQPQFQYQHPPPQQQQQPSQPTSMGRVRHDHMDEEYIPGAAPQAVPPHRGPGRPRKNPLPLNSVSSFTTPALPKTDPTLGVTLKTSFPVARIKRIMQADEDIGKVAQVTPHVVSRALELFMIQLISASAEHARGGNNSTVIKQEPAVGGGKADTGKAAPGSGGPRRILAQHMKKAILDGETFDFLADIVSKVPDAPTSKQKKDAGSDSDEGAAPAKGKKGAGRKRRKDSADDF
ncbi:hypothetical protein K431DRAFT_284584 [Polychaeton citri CBS 116435]|uniref:Transcription factor CBF/NF-Y/archaeal histone domain-containing protein n=1 Tax=Polychaeton citri CBS 116435 TaxID=1314669 RepID=A0A9P4QAZ7_9PEZI|nr:hypothetical protein K431DRAFT_284584 [Polychaeton citri CBS 116435]